MGVHVFRSLRRGFKSYPVYFCIIHVSGWGLGINFNIDPVNFNISLTYPLTFGG